MSDKPVILCVDDESNVLEGFKINLRKIGEILTAESGDAGLEILEKRPETAVVLSDMRMPGMDGATFLSKVHKTRPNTVRLLLTGFSDMEAAVRAVNEGQLFRFLTKPCPPEMLQATIRAALDQHRLITAEKELLQRTLLGSVQAMIEFLALDNPHVIGRAMRIRHKVRDIAKRVGLDTVWPAEFAAIFSQLGTATLAPALQQKIYRGEQLDATESDAVSRNMEAVAGIIRKIPRLEPAIDVLTEMSGSSHESDRLIVRLIRAAMIMESAESRGLSSEEVIEDLRARAGVVGEDVISAVAYDVEEQDAAVNTREVSIPDLSPGMIILNDVYADGRILLAPRGLTLNAAALEHIANFGARISTENVAVLVSDAEQHPAS